MPAKRENGPPAKRSVLSFFAQEIEEASANLIKMKDFREGRAIAVLQAFLYNTYK
jgi:hypothetical protein